MFAVTFVMTGLGCGWNVMTSAGRWINPGPAARMDCEWTHYGMRTTVRIWNDELFART